MDTNVIGPASTRISRDQARSAPALNASVIAPAPAAISREVSPTRVQMNNVAVVPPPVSAPERETSRNAKLTLPAPSVVAPPPSADSAHDLRRLESGCRLLKSRCPSAPHTGRQQIVREHHHRQTFRNPGRCTASARGFIRKHFSNRPQRRGRRAKRLTRQQRRSSSTLCRLGNQFAARPERQEARSPPASFPLHRRSEVPATRPLEESGVNSRRIQRYPSAAIGRGFRRLRSGNSVGFRLTGTQLASNVVPPPPSDRLQRRTFRLRQKRRLASGAPATPAQFWLLPKAKAEAPAVLES